MDSKEEILIEEIILGYLRSSKKIKLANMVREDGKDIDKFTITFEVSKDFGVTLTNNLNNQFSAFFNKNNIKPI